MSRERAIGLSEEQEALLESAAQYCADKSPIETVRRLIEDELGYDPAVFAEMAELFPDEFVLVGGDEVSSDSWLPDQGIRAFMDEQGMATARELQALFTSRLLPIVAAHGKTAVGWDEVIRGEVRPDTVIQLWLPGADPMGARALVSSGFYLDHMLSAADASMNPSTIRRGRSPTTDTTARAARRCRPLSSIAIAIRNPPKKRKIMGWVYSLATA